MLQMMMVFSGHWTVGFELEEDEQGSSGSIKVSRKPCRKV